MSNLSNAILEIYLPSLFPPSHHHHHQFKSLSLPPTLRNKQQMIKKKKKDSLAVNRHIGGRYPRSCSFTFRFEAWSFAARMQGTERRKNECNSEPFMEEGLCRAAGIYWSRYLPAQVVHGTCILSAPRAHVADRTYKYTWSLEKERERERRKKGERFEIHGRETSPLHGCFLRCWFRREKIDSDSRDSLLEKIVATSCNASFLNSNNL